MPEWLLIVGQEAPVADPPWEQVATAATQIRPSHSVILYKQDGRHLRADGARHVHTIVYYASAKSTPLVLGRREGGVRRGKAALQDDRVLVTPLENWGADGVEVFRRFFEHQELATEYSLRDPLLPCSPEEIRRAIGGG